MADPTGDYNPGAAPVVASKAKAPTYSTRPGAPIGLPSTPMQDPKTGAVTYQTNYNPPMWIAGQGPSTTGAGPYWGAPGTNGTQTGPTYQSNGGNFYVEGDEWSPGNDLANVVGLKQQLVQAGLLDPAKMSTGTFWGAADADAYKTMLGYANRYGIGASDMLAWMAQHPNTPVLALSPAIDIQSLADQVIAPLIGKSLTPAQMTQFVTDYHKWESANAQNAQAPPINGTTEAAGAPQSFATAYAKENFGSAEQQVNGAKLAQHLDSLFKGGG